MKTAFTRSMLLALSGTILSGATFWSSNLSGQERIEDKDLTKYVVILGINAAIQKETPFRVSPDSMKSSAMHKDEQIAVLIPDAGLSADRLAKVTEKEVTPIGQLWLRGLIPQVEGKNVPEDKLRTVTIAAGKEQIVAQLYFVGLQKNSTGEIELVLYGKGKEIAVHPVLEKHEEELKKPILVDMEAPADKPMIVSIKLFDKHRAQFEVVGEKK